MRVLMFAGLPGSGKTTFMSRYTDQGYAVFENPKNLDIVIKCLRSGADIAITDDGFVHKEIRDKATALLKERSDKRRRTTISWYFFENYPEACLSNLKWRHKTLGTSKEELDKDLRRLEEATKVYEVDKGIYPLRIWRSL